MINWIKITLTVLGILTGVGIIVGGFGYLISLFRKGGKQKDAELMSTAEQINQFYKSQNDDLKAIIAQKDLASAAREKDWNEKFQLLNKEVGELRGLLTAEKNQNERLEKIFQNRDPETQEFMKIMLKFVDDQAIIHKEIVRVLGDIHSMSKDEHDRDFKGTVTMSRQ